jgi:hypothetical protein
MISSGDLQNAANGQPATATAVYSQNTTTAV